MHRHDHRKDAPRQMQRALFQLFETTLSRWECSLLGVKGASINIYTEVGLVTLMGLISKHGILIFEFANDLQHAGRSKREAVIEATSIRLR
jgi:Cu/Ag efflux pump CusA